MTGKIIEINEEKIKDHLGQFVNKEMYLIGKLCTTGEKMQGYLIGFLGSKT